MSSTAPPTSTAASKAYFEQQREALIGEIAMSFEQVLANVNKLNRSLEAVIAVGHEFSSVEALWSQFEGVMGKDAAATHDGNTASEGGAGAEKGGTQKTSAGEEGQAGAGVKAEDLDEDETMAG